MRARPLHARATTAVGAFSSSPKAGRATAHIATACRSAMATSLAGTGRPTCRAVSLTTEPSGSAYRPATSGPPAPVACPATVAGAGGEGQDPQGPAPAGG